MNQQVAIKKQKFSAAIQSDAYKNLINNTLGDVKRSQRFVAAISSAVATNPQLQECDPGSILSAALLGEGLNLSPSPQLGQYYMVPFKRKANVNKGISEATLAQFQLGYKGYIQLAIRSGFYAKINVLDIKKGELIKYDPLLEVIEVNLIDDEIERENAETTGYYAMFEYLNGFKKTMYWSKDKMMSHADKYSQSFKKFEYDRLQKGQIPQSDLWKYSSFWYKDFDGMAFKTMLRQLISRWGIMSTELTEAYTKDQAVIKENGEYDYIDGSSQVVDDSSIEIKGHAPLYSPECTDEAFSRYREKYSKAIMNKELDIAEFKSGVSKKWTLTDAQVAEINKWSIAND
jgi:recombination protein RecT